VDDGERTLLWGGRGTKGNEDRKDVGEILYGGDGLDDVLMIICWEGSAPLLSED
jgi:hypothetical protein